MIFGQSFDISAIVYCCYRQPNWNTGNLLGNTLEAPNFLKIGLYFWEMNWIIFLRKYSGRLKFPSKPTSAKNSKLSTFKTRTLIIPIFKYYYDSYKFQTSVLFDRDLGNICSFNIIPFKRQCKFLITNYQTSKFRNYIAIRKYYIP